MTENKCEKCETPKIMYYREYCPKCEKPKPKIQYNLIECLYYIEANGQPGFKEKFWDMLLDEEEVMNDTALKLWNDPTGTNPLLKELFKKMKIKDKTMWFETSW